MAFFNDSFGAAVAPKESTGGGYLNPSKLPDGGSMRFYILSDEPLTGYELWFKKAEGGLTPRRVPQEPDEALIAELAADVGGTLDLRDGKPACNAFAAFAVWDYETEEIRIFSATQKTILRELNRLTSDPDYADLTEWDCQISRTGKGTDTRYTVDFKPSRARGPLAARVKAAWTAAGESGFDLEALFRNGNPFAA